MIVTVVIGGANALLRLPLATTITVVSILPIAPPTETVPSAARKLVGSGSSADL